MKEMLGYIFNEMHFNKIEMRNVEKILKNQRAFNRKLATLLFVTSLYAVSSTIRIEKYEKKLASLNKKVDELKKGDSGM